MYIQYPHDTLKVIHKRDGKHTQTFLFPFLGWTVPEEKPQDAGHFNSLCHSCYSNTCSVRDKV